MQKLRLISIYPKKSNSQIIFVIYKEKFIFLKIFLYPKISFNFHSIRKYLRFFLFKITKK